SLRSLELRRRAALVGAAELNSLRQRQLAGKVDRVRLPAHVIFPAIAAAFATATGIFLAAERAADLRTARAGVHVRNSAIASDGTYEFLSFAHVVGEDR